MRRCIWFLRLEVGWFRPGVGLSGRYAVRLGGGGGKRHKTQGERGFAGDRFFQKLLGLIDQSVSMVWGGSGRTVVSC